jgi:hypothetical protein
VKAVKICYTMEKNTAAGGYGRTLRVVCILFVYECTFYIVGRGHLECSYRWCVQGGLYEWRRYQKSERSYDGFGL